MKLFILGATGRVGSHILRQAVSDGHHIQALVRNPEKIQTDHRNITLIQGNALHEEVIERGIRGMDLVISALNTDGNHTLSVSMPLIIAAMKKEGIQRIITVGTAGILQSRVSPELLRYQSSESKRKTTFDAQEHEKVYHLLRESDLEWTIVCPTYLPDGDYTGNYRVERDVLPEGGERISVPDTAEFTYQQIYHFNYVNSRVGISY